MKWQALVRVLQIRSGWILPENVKYHYVFVSSFVKTPMVNLDDDFKKNVGTLITTDEGDSMEQPIISGIAFNRDEAGEVSILDSAWSSPGIASSVLSPPVAISKSIWLSKTSHENGLTDFTFTVNHRGIW